MNICGSLMDIFDEKNKDIYVETMLHAYAHCTPAWCVVLFYCIQKPGMRVWG